MKSGDTAGYAHPSAETLALYSRGDLPLFKRLRVRHHVSQCLECESEISLLWRPARNSIANQVMRP